MPYFITNDSIDIYYECIGNGEPLVFIHGLGASSEMYKPQVEYLKKEFKVVIIDLRGNGESGKLECPKEFYERAVLPFSYFSAAIPLKNNFANFLKSNSPIGRLSAQDIHSISLFFVQANM